MRSAEMVLWDAINSISELRISLFNENVDYTDLSYLGVDIRDIFPSKYRRIEFKNHEAKRAVMNKIAQHTQLVREFVESFAASQQRRMGQSVMWPIFPTEKIRDIYQQIMDLGGEIWLDLFEADYDF